MATIEGTLENDRPPDGEPIHLASTLTYAPQFTKLSTRRITHAKYLGKTEDVLKESQRRDSFRKSRTTK